MPLTPCSWPAARMIDGGGKRGLMCYQQSILGFLHHTSPLIVLLLLVPPSVSQSPYQKYLECSHPTTYPCGNQNYSVSFPFWSSQGDRPEYCGYPGYKLECIADSMLLVEMDGPGDKLYPMKNIDYESQVLTIADPNFVGQSCPQAFTDATLNFNLFSYFDEQDLNFTLYSNCTSVDEKTLHSFTCQNGQKWYYDWPDELRPDVWAKCKSVGNITVNQTIAYTSLASRQIGFLDLMNALQKGFGVRWSVGQDWCDNCSKSGGACGYDSQNPDAHTCYCPNNTTSPSCSCKKGNRNTRNIIIGVCVGVAALFLGCFFCFFCYQRRKRQQRSNTSNLLSSTASSKPSSIKDPELGTHNYNTHVFSYEELQEATNGFDASRELGDGGFGTVYKGTLRDGRVVAVKRLYENNYKRVEQFVNEVQILSGLRHQNLVTLYGCTSHHSRELLLVYEFVPNGTVADHLHGLRATDGALTWAIRLNIAIETASALAYLHAIEPQIIHRDVKTNNILLDKGFHVKVADFGLSRLFPVHATHVSTLPQGTPGYVDPEYHQCYQLTDKSDVYSFGVVLVELISSKPAVDISRHRHEINLANMAIVKIQNNELDQLIDPGLGYQADWEMERMIKTVAELAFRCLQGDRNMRPSIKEAMEELRTIQSRGEKEEVEADVKTTEDTGLLKNTLPYSPDSVTKPWESTSTTPNTSSSGTAVVM